MVELTTEIRTKKYIIETNQWAFQNAIYFQKLNELSESFGAINLKFHCNIGFECACLPIEQNLNYVLNTLSLLLYVLLN